MREIKFRAWDTKAKQWLKWHHLTGAIFRQEGDKYIDKHPQNSRVELQQYTGLKDKNGKEIYEGDIVREYQHRFDDNDEWVLLPYDKPDVVTMGRFPVYWLEREGFGYEGEDLKDSDDFEVIGNIYENPELLEDKK